MSRRKTTLFRFYNEAVEGSLKNLGCGFRTVIALPPGRKWITLVDWTTCDVATISVKDWGRMKAEPVTEYSARIERAMKARIKYKFTTDDGTMGKPTGAIKDALKSLQGAAS